MQKCCLLAVVRLIDCVLMDYLASIKITLRESDCPSKQHANFSTCTHADTCKISITEIYSFSELQLLRLQGWNYVNLDTNGLPSSAGRVHRPSHHLHFY